MVDKMERDMDLSYRLFVAERTKRNRTISTNFSSYQSYNVL